MGRYKRYLFDEEVDVPRSSKFCRQRTGAYVERVPADLQLGPDEDGQRCRIAFRDNMVSTRW
jgi:hypothetical protein